MNLLDMTELLLKGAESTQKHMHVRLEQVYFTLRYESFVYFYVTEKSAPLRNDVRFIGHLWDRPSCGNQPICGTHPSWESYIFSAPEPLGSLVSL